MSARDLFFAVQESIKSALVKKNVAYLGDNTLKEGMLALGKQGSQLMFNSLLQNPDKEWRALFSQSTADGNCRLELKTKSSHWWKIFSVLRTKRA